MRQRPPDPTSLAPTSAASLDSGASFLWETADSGWSLSLPGQEQAPSGSGQTPVVVAERYALGRPLGKGSFGAVWAAHDTQSGEEVAIKLLSPTAAWRLPVLRQEAATLAWLKLPGVVRLRDDGVDRGQVFLVMELIDGAPFPGHLQADSWEALRGPMRAIAETLSRVHLAGVVHRDLKPGNVLVDRSGLLFLLDFGLATGHTPASADTATNFTGTPRYASPEACRGQPVGPAADLYALGVMAFEALTGLWPHAQSDIRAVIARRGAEPAPSLASLRPSAPAEAVALIDALLASDPAARPESAAAVVAALKLAPSRVVPAARAARVALPISAIGRKHNLAPRDPSFAGRSEDLAALSETLARRGRVSLCGLGGVGKSALANSYAWQHLDTYSRVCWVDARAGSLQQNFAALADHPLDLGLTPETSTADKKRAVRQRLADSGDQPTLLILDNVEDETWADLVSDHTTHILVTTRQPHLGLPTLRVEALPPKEALALLIGERGLAPAELARARTLCERLGRLPLALVIAGRAMSMGARAEPLLASIEELGSGASAGSTEVEGHQLGPALRATFDASLALLDPRNRRDQTARHLLWVAGSFAPTGIPTDLLFDAAGRLSGQSLDVFICSEALGRLVDLGLVCLDERGAPVLHRLTSAYARAAGGAAAAAATMDAMADLSERTEDDLLALLRLQMAAPHLLEASQRLGRASPRRWRWISVRLAGHLRALARYEEVLSACAPLGEEDDEIEAALRYERGLASFQLSRFNDGLLDLEQAAALRALVLGEHHIGTALALGALGRLLTTLERPRDALDVLSRALAIHQRQPGPETIDHAQTLNKIAYVLQLEGRNEEALDLSCRALEIMERRVGPDHPDTAYQLACHALSLRKLGRHSEAVRAALRAATITEQHYGPDHPDVAQILLGLGQAHHQAGELPQALAVLRRALPVLEEALGPEGFDAGAALAYIGRVLVDLKDFAEAKAALSRSHGILLALYGPDDSRLRSVARSLEICDGHLTEFSR